MSNDKKSTTSIYKNVKTNGITKNIEGEQTIQTEETKVLKGENGKKDKEVLIGKDIETVNEIKESHESLKKKLLNKLM